LAEYFKILKVKKIFLEVQLLNLFLQSLTAFSHGKH